MNKYGNRYKWTEKMKQLIKDKYPTTSAPCIAKELEVSVHAVYKVAEVLGVKKEPRHIHIDSNGYRVISWMKNREIFKNYEQRIIMEKYLGRPLESYEIVHHINGDKLDNSYNNLILTTRRNHPKDYHLNTCLKNLKRIRK